MAAEELNLTPREKVHEKLMVSILKEMSDTPLVLKGGTALMVAYGLDRFSEDLDFDAPVKLNLAARIKRGVPYAISLINVDLVKNTDTMTRYRVSYNTEHGPRKLKIEVSYRTPAPANEINVINGVRVATVSRILDQKLQAAHDGEDPRTKMRDLYDLDFISRKFPHKFTRELSERLVEFAQSPEDLASRYRDAYLEDDLVRDRVLLEDIVLRLHYKSEEIRLGITERDKRIEQICTLKNAAGAAYTFFQISNEAIKKVGNDSYEVDWKKVEESTIRESIGEHNQHPETVYDVLCKHSPGAVTLKRQADLRVCISQFANEIQSANQKIQSTSLRNDRGFTSSGTSWRW